MSRQSGGDDVAAKKAFVNGARVAVTEVLCRIERLYESVDASHLVKTKALGNHLLGILDARAVVAEALAEISPGKRAKK